ncbi:MIP/aquaporin family protein [[Mycoplasma] mobile]|uniref:Glycerol uptake facilitator protein n=1 Tax=Mycoplasma mobile (strain ATCC 43663 / 163K / NCTC 11711) TaxID=267748 RepID=Q6KHZ7_MYCM1|nr:MIP/aquaporin family protein [[Mycoplasma] mobile]AAT27779.1 glycerol uptake facilitator protein [Mycoplasma mobile 163K]
MNNLGIFFGAEFIGTLILILIGNGVVASIALKKTKATGQGFLYASFGWMTAVFLGVMVSTSVASLGNINVPNGMINPVFVIINMINKNLPIEFGFIAILAEFLGAGAAQLIVISLYWNHYKATEDADAVGATFFTSPAIKSKWNNFYVEIIATFILVLILSFTSSVTSPTTTIGIITGALPGAFNVGWIIFGIAVSLGSTTGYSLNPARDLIPRILHSILPIPNKGSSNWSYSWIPSVGPIVGGLVGMLVTPGLFY